MITYQEKKEINVYVDGKYTGTIKHLGEERYQYWPQGKRRFAGEVGTLSEVKKSLEEL